MKSNRLEIPYISTEDQGTAERKNSFDESNAVAGEESNYHRMYAGMFNTAFEIIEGLL